MGHKTIDIHTHPVFSKYYDAIVRHNALREDSFLIPSDYTVEHHLELMDELEVQWALLGLSSPHPYFGDEQECIDICRAFNEEAAQAKRDHPTRFGFSALLPHPCLDAAIDEAIYAIDVLGADAVKLASNARGLYMGDPALDPLMEELNKRNVILTMHPSPPAFLDRSVFTAKAIPMFEFICDSTRAVINMIGNGVFDRYPNLRLIVPHNGSFLPNIQVRFPRIVDKLSKEGVINPIDYDNAMSKLYFDTSGDPVPYVLEMLLTMTDPSRIMYGSDYIFNPDDTFRHKIGLLRNHLDEDEELRKFRDMIMYENAKELFGLDFLDD